MKWVMSLTVLAPLYSSIGRPFLTDTASGNRRFDIFCRGFCSPCNRLRQFGLACSCRNDFRRERKSAPALHTNRTGERRTSPTSSPSRDDGRSRCHRAFLLDIQTLRRTCEPNCRRPTDNRCSLPSNPFFLFSPLAESRTNLRKTEKIKNKEKRGKRRSRKNISNGFDRREQRLSVGR